MSMLEKNVVEEFDMKIAHVGINASDSKDAQGLAKLFDTFLNLPVSETPVSYFNGDLIEIMKEHGRGKKGHIGFSVNNCEEAMDYFIHKGLTAIEESKKFDLNGKCIFVYFKEEIGGFAIHLIQEGMGEKD